MQRMNNETRGRRRSKAGLWIASLLLWPLGAVAQDKGPDKGKVLEEVVARVNSDAITRGDVEHARAQMVDDVRHD